MQDNHQDNPQEYSKTSKKPRKDFSRESRDRKRLGELATDVILASSAMSIPLIIITGVL